MEWFSQNGFFILLLLLFVAMHLFGHGGHGGHGAHGRDRRQPPRGRGNTQTAHDHGDSPDRPANSPASETAAPTQPASTAEQDAGGGHRHRGAC